MTTAAETMETPTREADSQPWSAVLAVESALNAAADAEEFSRYVAYKEEMLTSDEIKRSMLQEAVEEHIATQQKDARPRLVRERRMWIVGTATVWVGTAALVVAGLSFASTWPAVVQSVSALAAFIGVVASFAVPFITFQAIATLSEFDEQLHRQAEVSIRPLAAEQFALAAQAVLGRHGVLRFPRLAPRLVELDKEGLVASRTVQRLERFVTEHATSALGISGPRGAGKTSSLNTLAVLTRQRGGIAVVLPAPVEYSTMDLLRSIAYALAENVDMRRNSWSRTRRVRIELVAGGLAALTLGTCVLLAALMPDVAARVVGFVGSAWAFFLAGMLLLTGLWLFFRSLRLTSPRRGADNALRPIRDLVAQLEYEATRTGTITGKGWGLAELEIGTTRRRRELSHADIIDRLRRSLSALAQVWPSVVIAIDELDKLPNREAAIRAINTLKDLRHINGVHLIVTVSDEARASFDLFGPERDAFDSTFDVIVQVDRLDFETARLVINARVVGFPAELIALSYIGSAGLARDLIRRARQYFDTGIAQGSIPGWRALALECLRDETESMMIAYAELHRVETQMDATGALFEPLLDSRTLEQTQVVPDRVDALPQDFARIYARIAVLRISIDWIAGVKIDELEDPRTIDRLRDAVLLATKSGQPSLATSLAYSAVNANRQGP